MFKLSEATDLEKAGKSLGSLFAAQVSELEKSVSSHEAQATHHQALSNLHKGHADAHQAMHDAMDNSHEMKGHMAKGVAFHKAAADHHSALHEVHSAEAEKCKAARDTMKGQAEQWGGVAPVAKGTVSSTLSLNPGGSGGTGNSISDMVHDTTIHLAKKTMEMMDNDPEVQQYMRNTVLKLVGEAIGNTVVPTSVSAVTPNAPRAVPRAGQPNPGSQAPARPNVPIRFEKLVAIEEE